jgi:4-amino-4-deoxy-L-arabinose transferase-like glycosyltransferase
MRDDSEQGARSFLARRQDFLVILLTIGLLGGLLFYNLDGWKIDDDEGSFLYQAWRVSEGEQPYTDFFSSHWPFFLYTAGILLDLSGDDIGVIRAVPALFTLTTAIMVFLLARELVPVEGAWLAMLAYLLHPAVFSHGRTLYIESFMLFFDVLGLYLFHHGWNRKQRSLLILGGLSFGVSMFFKPMGILPFAGCLLWILAHLWRHREHWHLLLSRALLFSSSFGLFVGAMLVGLAIREPAFYSSAIGAHLTEQGDQAPALVNGSVLLLQYVLLYLPLMAFALPTAWINAREADDRSLIAWQLPTALAFLALSRPLFPRHLDYLTPALAILFAMALEPLRQWPKRSFLFVSVVIAVLLPWVMKDIGQAFRTEDDTAGIVDLIRRETDEQAYVISDYQELNFYAGRRSTYQGAEISLVMIEGGQITSDRLIEEVEKYPVEMVIIDVSAETAHQLAKLPDYERLRSYLGENFELLGRYAREKQLLEIHIQRRANGSK